MVSNSADKMAVSTGEYQIRWTNKHVGRRNNASNIEGDLRLA